MNLHLNSRFGSRLTHTTTYSDLPQPVSMLMHASCPRPLSTWTPISSQGTALANRPGIARPPTERGGKGQSRPGTARPQTGASARHETSYVIAVFEGRGVAREVGLAAIERDTGRVILIQVRLIHVLAEYMLSSNAFYRLQTVKHT